MPVGAIKLREDLHLTQFHAHGDVQVSNGNIAGHYWLGLHALEVSVAVCLLERHVGSGRIGIPAEVLRVGDGIWRG